MPARREFFAREVTDVAPELLGCVLQHSDGAGTVGIRITEVEAYAGERDPGAHSYRGRTERNKTMFGEPGHVYCYFTYGLHHAVNLVAGTAGQPYGCLIRAGEVIRGAELARKRREAKPRKNPLLDHELARGPACIAQSFDVDLGNDGDDLFGSGWEVLLPSGELSLPHLTGPRVGVSGPGGDGTAFPWRFWLPEEPSVSAYKPASRPGRVRSGAAR
ncbi:DNA-3-methyladenine glycosylase [Saxibacter everestensis]|uniref:Putative 3-methyladenine DNA glycosylase n=2 Tax=Saxibacter everestensis TaxID=2909229 RepID=A0ABY8QZ14_9MICO|nr:DNA-3-methyladenine glycosylase [Brevibacteriaceae bacterium ZFBP1038]